MCAMRRLVLLAVIAGLAACTTEVPESGAAFTEARGLTYQPGCTSHDDQLIRNAAAWQVFWAVTHPEGEPAPAVDFQSASVLAVCAPLASPGHGYEITAWEAAPANRVGVYATDVLPGDGCVHAAVVAYAFHTIKLDTVVESADFSHATAVHKACGALDQDYGWQTLSQGQYSGCSEPLEAVIRSEEEWAAFWARLHAPVNPAPERPAVDFASESVIATCTGARPSGGYATVIAHLTAPDEAGQVTVGVRDLEPGSVCVVTDAVTQPYHVIRVNRALSGATFRRNTSVLDCS